MKLLIRVVTFLPREMKKNALFIISFLLTACLFLYLANLEHLETKEYHRRRLFRAGKKLRPQDITAEKTATVIEENIDSSKSEIRILGWTHKFRWKEDWFSEGRHAFKKCGFSGEVMCTYTSDKTKLLESDVLLFRGRKIPRPETLPSKRSPHQKWVFFENEPPTKVWSHLSTLDPTDIRDMFNLTSTYAIDSDIPFRTELTCTPNIKHLQAIEGVDFAAKKTRGVAWFVSHCDTPSKREAYVEELKKFIDVDIYGKCGPYSCDNPPFGASKEAIKAVHLADCDQLVLNETYKFYLAFENSLCEHYVTEKLTRMFIERLNIIPVVMGHEDYSRLLPEGSYIDVRDFASPEDLAAHLKYIDEHDNIYNDYIRKKLSVDCLFPRDVPYECRLCEYLHKHRTKRQIVSDVASYWGVEERCLDTKQFFADVVDSIP